jgi:hypothetical protein
MEMKKQKARIMWTIDGEHWQLLKEGSIERLWDSFVLDPEIKKHIILNPNGKFRLYGETGMLIGELPKKESSEEMH